MVHDSEGNPLEDVADKLKYAIDFSDEILDEQFEYHSHMRVQDILALHVTRQEPPDIHDNLAVMMTTLGDSKYILSSLNYFLIEVSLLVEVVNLAAMDKFSQSAYANFMA